MVNDLAKKDRLNGADRLIVALDVASQTEALEVIQALTNVSFFKIGLRLLLNGQVMRLIETLREERNGRIFLDIKWGGDIGNTASEFVQACIESSVVKFMTLIEAASTAITQQTIAAGKEARRAANVSDPHFLMVPYLSSLDATDLNQTQGKSDLNQYIVERGRAMLALGCDGLIVSGDAIRACRQEFGDGIDIVSPGIRPEWASQNDHKRFTTPAEAIEMGADYLVVGRPIIKAGDKLKAARSVIDEIDKALEKRDSKPGGTSGENTHNLAANSRG